jgi:hypothetical protein
VAVHIDEYQGAVWARARPIVRSLWHSHDPRPCRYDCRRLLGLGIRRNNIDNIARSQQRSQRRISKS